MKKEAAMLVRASHRISFQLQMIALTKRNCPRCLQAVSEAHKHLEGMERALQRLKKHLAENEKIPEPTPPSCQID